ncbi:hypothetical protein GCM10027345_29630 [Hymenobacter daeguensis]
MDGSSQQMGREMVPHTDEEPVRDRAPDKVAVSHMAAVRARVAWNPPNRREWPGFGHYYLRALHHSCERCEAGLWRLSRAMNP